MSKVLVVGSINMDEIISVKRMPVAGENVYCQDISYAFGGKGANQASATAKLGLQTLYYGAVGDDDFGKQLLANLERNNIDSSRVEILGKQTGVAYILLEENGDNRIIVAPGANEKLTVDHINRCITPLLKEVDMVLMQLEIPLDCVERLIDLSKEHGVKTFVDAGPVRGCTASQIKNAWCISPNETELAALVNRSINSEQEMIQASEELLAYGVECVLIKLGDKGCYYISKEKRIRKPGYKVDVVDTTAAGDSFGAGFAAAIVRGSSVESALEYANKCGAIAVTKKGAGTSLPTADAVEHFERDYLKL